jgi:HK97 family phage major capsid protein
MPEIVTRVVDRLPLGTNLSRFIHAHLAGRGSDYRAMLVAKEWTDTPLVHRTFEWLVKAAVAPGTTTDAAWAGPLIQTGLATEALNLLRGVSILGQLERYVRLVPFEQRIPRATGPALMGGWIAEGAPAPNLAEAYDSVGPLHATKAGAIVVCTEELVRLSRPAAEATVREHLIGGLAAFLDQQFLLPTIVAATGRPASITNGATAITSTGTTAAQISADLAGLRAAITTPGQKLVWVMRPSTMATISAALGAANSGLPATLNALPVIASANSPQQIVLLDGAGVLVADEGGFEASTTREATLQMSDAPMFPADATSVYRSLWPENEVGIKALRWINWLRASNGAVAYMTTAY